MSAPADLQRAFERIGATRMRGVALVNPALRVEATAFRAWRGHQVGVLIAPWTVNLVLLPSTDEALPALALGEHRVWDLPGGRVEFMGGQEPECGPFDVCPLFSPPAELPDQATAVAMANGLIDTLLAEPSGGPSAPARRAFLGGRSGVYHA